MFRAGVLKEALDQIQNNADQAEQRHAADDSHGPQVL